MHAAASRRPGGRRMSLVAAVLLAALTGCDTADGGSNANPDLTAPTVTTATTSEIADRDAVVAAYDEYWVQTHEVPHQPLSTWRKAMAEVAVDPQLKTVLQGMRFARDVGITSYGSVTSRVSEVAVNGKVATVVDCQDASNSGKADLKTGEKRTVGVARNSVRARLERDPTDGTWKVAQITFPGGDC